MKNLYFLITIIPLCFCNEIDAQFLSSKTWQCLRVDDSCEDNDIEGYYKQCISNGTIKEEHKDITNENTIALNFLADVQEILISSTWVFNSDNRLNITGKNGREYYREFKWTFEGSELILTDQKDKKIKLQVDYPNDEELIISKKVLDIEVKIFLSVK